MNLIRNNKIIVKSLGVFIAAVGFVVIFGWILDIDLLKSIHPRWVTMKFATALSFFLSGIILYSTPDALENSSFDLKKILISICTAVMLFLIGTMLLSLFFDSYTGIENLFVKETGKTVMTTVRERPSLGTMINFISLAIAGFVVTINMKRVKLHLLTVGFINIFFGFLALLGYALNTPLLYYSINGFSTAMELHTAVLFSLIGAGYILFCTSQFRTFGYSFFQYRVIIFWEVLLAIGLGALVYYLYGYSKKIVIDIAIEDSKAQISALESFRTLYTREVVSKARLKGLKVSHFYKGDNNTIPLPATLTKLIGKEVGKMDGGSEAFLYSGYPFPWQKKEGGLNDSFRKDAWSYLNKNPSKSFYRVLTDVKGIRYIRYARADRMRSACISCHNTHPQTPKSDWKLGDVRGILEVKKPLKGFVLTSGSEVHNIFLMAVLLGFLGILGLSGFAIMTKKAQDAGKVAKKALKSKSNFLANMSHEVRTPMNGIVGMTDLILNSSNLSSECRSFAKNIKECSSNLLTIIDDILDYSKIDAGKLLIDKKNFNLDRLIKSVLSLYHEEAEHKEVKLNYNINSNVPLGVYTDDTRLSQILNNLLSNAMKFTHHGEINLVVNAEKKIDSNQFEIHFTIQDTGIGIAKNIQKKIFSIFTQADVSTTRYYGGTGLGLSICKELAELLGGEIGVDSTLGKGSKFYFTILTEEVPLNEIENDAKDVFLDKRLSEKYPLDILLVEDNPVNQKLALAMLKKQGYDADLAINGLEAVEALEYSNYDLILMDMQMPVMDGVEATKKIRELYSDNKVTIVAITANVFPEDKEKCLNAGMNYFMKKPISIRELQGIISNISTKKVV